jgi:hypothetical protein
MPEELTVEQLLDELEGRRFVDAPYAAPPHGRMSAGLAAEKAEQNLNTLMGYQQEAQSVPSIFSMEGLAALMRHPAAGGQPDPLTLGAGQYFGSTGRGLQEKGLLAARNAAPGLQSLGVLRETFPMQEYQGAINNRLTELRQHELADRDIWGSLKYEQPEVLGGTGIGFLSTMVAMEMFPWTRGVARNKNVSRWRTAGQRMKHEALAGGIYGAATPTLSDDEAAMVVATGLFTGAISAGAFTGAGKIFELSPQTKEIIARRIRLEKLFSRRGIFTLPELMNSSGMLKIQGWLENIPWSGMSRRARAEQFKGLTEEFLYKMFPNAHEKLAAKSGKELINGLSQKIFDTFQRNKVIVAAKYDEVARLLDSVPRGAAPEVRLSQYRAAANRLLRNELGLPEEVQNAELIRQARLILEAGEENIPWKRAVDTLRRIKESARVENVKALKGEVTRERYAAMVELEQSLWDDVKNFADDLWARGEKPNAQNIYELLRDADDAYKRLLLPFYAKDDIQKLVTGGEAGYDNIAYDFLNLEKGPRGTMRVRSETTRTGQIRPVGVEETDLLSRGQQSNLGTFRPGYLEDVTEQDFARYIVIRESLSGASSTMSKGSPVWNPRIDPKEFRNELNAFAKAGWGDVFTPRQQKYLEAYIDTIDIAERVFTKETTLGSIFAGAAGGTAVYQAGQAGTGEGDFGWWAAAGAAAGVLGTVQGARFLLGTPMGHKWMMNLQNAMVKAHGIDQIVEGGIDVFENKAVRAAYATLISAFTKWLASEAPEFLYQQQYGSAREEMALSGQWEGANPLIQRSPKPTLPPEY